MAPPEGNTPGAGPRTEGERSEDPIEKIAESFVERCQRGERPTIEEYVAKHPNLAQEIRAILPTLLVMEEMAGSGAGPVGATSKRPGGDVLQHLGEYRILREIGRGGMGVVYEAVQETLGRRVALKILPAGSLKDKSRIERFLREARAAARLHHTSIVPVFGVGEEGGTHYYAMQFIRGQGLDEVLRELKRLRAAMDGEPPLEGSRDAAEGSLAATSARNLLAQESEERASAGEAPEPAAEPPAGDGSSSRLLTGEGGSSSAHRSRSVYFQNVARLGLQVAEALAYAHGEGVLHRDIKPSNLLLDTQGAAWITDFGLAKSEDSDELTQTGDLVGTLRYMAPERFKGWSDARSDVYGLGLTFGEVIIGAPFAYSTAGATPEGRAALSLGSMMGLAPTPAWTKFGPEPSSGHGAAVAGGDLTGDCYSDVLVGAPGSSFGGPSAGMAALHASAGNTSGAPALASVEITALSIEGGKPASGMVRLGGVAAVAGDSRVLLFWQGPDEAAGFNVYPSENPNGQNPQVVSDESLTSSVREDLDGKPLDPNDPQKVFQGFLDFQRFSPSGEPEPHYDAYDQPIDGPQNGRTYYYQAAAVDLLGNLVRLRL